VTPAAPRALVRVLIADSDRLFAERLRLRLSSDDRLEVLSPCTDAAAAVDLAEAMRPDVIVLDAGLHDRERIEKLWRDALGANRLIVLANVDDVAGAQGTATVFVRKDRGIDAIAEHFLEIASLAELATPV
jgi:DNA-binding NarL/FixJ family response regulator